MQEADSPWISDDPVKASVCTVEDLEQLLRPVIGRVSTRPISPIISGWSPGSRRNESRPRAAGATLRLPVLVVGQSCPLDAHAERARLAYPGLEHAPGNEVFAWVAKSQDADIQFED